MTFLRTPGGKEPRRTPEVSNRESLKIRGGEMIKVQRELCRHLYLINSLKLTTCSGLRAMDGLIRASPQIQAKVHLYVYPKSVPHSKVASDIVHFRVLFGKLDRPLGARERLLLQSKKIIKCVLLTRVRGRGGRGRGHGHERTKFVQMSKLGYRQ